MARIKKEGVLDCLCELENITNDLERVKGKDLYCWFIVRRIKMVIEEIEDLCAKCNAPSAGRGKSE